MPSSQRTVKSFVEDQPEELKKKMSGRYRFQSFYQSYKSGRVIEFWTVYDTERAVVVSNPFRHKEDAEDHIRMLEEFNNEQSAEIH